MAYNGKYTSIQHIVENIYRKAGLNIVDWEEAIAHTVRLMGLVGIPYQYVTKTTNSLDGNVDPIEIVDYRGEVPSDLVTLISCRKVYLNDNGEITGFYPMVESTDIYHATNIEEPVGELNTFPASVTLSESEIDEYGDITTTSVQYNMENGVEQYIANYTYKIDNDIIFTNFKDGYIEMVYKGYPTDSNGYPMIPDDEKYLSALEYYIISQIDWKRWRMNPASPGLKAVLNDSEQKADWYIAAARTKAHIPSVDKMESLKNMWLRSIPKINNHNNGFKTLNVQEMRKNNHY